MHAKYLIVNDSGHREAVEAIGEELPEPNAETALALVVEAIDPVDGSTFMVSSKEEEVVRVFDLVGEKKADGLNALFPSVDVVSEEQVVGVWREATILKKSEKIRELAMDIT